MIYFFLSLHLYILTDIVGQEGHQILVPIRSAWLSMMES